MPIATPLTRPVDEPTVATEVLPDDQVPPDAVDDNDVLLPRHTPSAPEMVPAVGVAVTVTAFVAVAVPQVPETE